MNIKQSERGVASPVNHDEQQNRQFRKEIRSKNNNLCIHKETKNCENPTISYDSMVRLLCYQK